MSPRHQIASGRSASTASRTAVSACRFAWMSEMTATRIRSRHSLALAAVLLAAAAVWAVAVALLWQTEIPSALQLPKVDPHRFFTSAELTRYWRYERFYYATWA